LGWSEAAANRHGCGTVAALARFTAVTPEKKKPVQDSFVRRVLIVIALTAVALLAWKLRGVLLMLFGAVVVAAIVRAIAEPLGRWTRMPDGFAVGFAAIAMIGLIAGTVWLLGAQISGQARAFAETVPKGFAKIEEWLSALGFRTELHNWQSAVTGGRGIMSTVSTLATSASNAIANALVVIFGGIFLAAEPRFYRGGAIKLVPEARRATVADAMLAAERALRLWLKGQLMAMVIIGLMTGVGLWLLGVPSALVLGIIAGLLEFIPFAGPILAAVPAVVLALAQSTDLAVWTVAMYIFVQHSEAYLIQPVIQRYAVDLPAVVLLFSLLAFAALFGPLGVIFAAPLAVVSYVLVKRLYVVEALDTPTPIPGENKG
jgi:predicted PurR-regulated permease PerM